jgi:hypothetical protein
MVFYIIPYVFMIFMALLSIKIKGNGFKFLFLLGIIPSLFIIGMRGDVGTDTAAYISLINYSNVDLEERVSTLEPFFLMIVYLKNYFNLESRLVLNIFSVSIVLVLFSFFYKNKHRFLIFSFLIFPVFLYDMTMNGIRYGMAFALSCFFISQSKENLYKFSSSNFIYFLSLLNHKTAIFFYIFKNAQSASIKNFIVICFVMILGFFTLQGYLVDKLSLYSEYSSPSIFSGVQPLIISFLLLTTNSIFFKKNLRRNSYLFVIQLIFYIVTQFSYAGIRFQFLELFYIIVLLVLDKETKNYNVYMLLLMLIGLFGFLFRLNNFYSTIGQGESPFLPYNFFWENK